MLKNVNYYVRIRYSIVIEIKEFWKRIKLNYVTSCKNGDDKTFCKHDN